MPKQSDYGCTFVWAADGIFDRTAIHSISCVDFVANRCLNLRPLMCGLVLVGFAGSVKRIIDRLCACINTVDELKGDSRLFYLRF